MNKGKIVQISGPVIDAVFENGALPRIREALTVTINGETRVMEVAQHIGNKTVRSIMLSASEGLARGATVIATGEGIKVPVGQQSSR